MAFSNKQQINSMESSVNTLAETKQNILNDTNKNEVSLLKLTATNLYAGIFYYLGQPLEQLLGNKWQINPAPFRGFICGLFPGRRPGFQVDRNSKRFVVRSSLAPAAGFPRDFFSRGSHPHPHPFFEDNPPGEPPFAAFAPGV